MYECGPSIRAAFVPNQCCYSAVMVSPWKPPKTFVEKPPHKLPVEGTNQTKNQRARQMASTRFMKVADRESGQWRDYQTREALVQRLRDDAKVVAPRPPKPLFIPGQSIIQFWAAWFEKAEAPVKQYSKKNRPGWFSGEVVSRDGYESIRYAGILQPEQHLYRTY